MLFNSIFFVHDEKYLYEGLLSISMILYNYDMIALLNRVLDEKFYNCNDYIKGFQICKKDYR